jgi:hypothetical protein
MTASCGYLDPRMEILAEGLLLTIVYLFIGLTSVIIIFGAAVWFGLFVLVPRIQRALDRANADEEEAGDRPD